MFDDEDAGPKEVDVAVVAANLFHRLFETGDGAASNAEDLEELVPEAFGLGFFARLGGPFAGKLDGVVANLVPANRHSPAD